MRRLPILISVGIVVLAFVSFWFYKQNRVAYLTRRDFRLVAVATQALKEAIETLSADKQKDSITVTRKGAEVTVAAKASVDRSFVPSDVAERCKADCILEYSAPTTLDDALAEVPERGGFEGLVVFDGHGQLVTRRDFGRQAHPLLVLSAEGDGGTKDKPSGDDGKKKAGDGSGAAEKGLGAFSRGAATAIVDLGGEPHRLFCEPLALPGPPAETLVFCGVVLEAAFQGEARATSPFVLGLFAVALLVTLLAQPILRLVLLAPHARVAFADVVTIGVCTFVILITLTVTILSGGIEWQLRKDEDLKLAALGDSIRRNVETEIRQVVTQIHDLDLRLSDLPQRPAGPRAAPLPVLGLLGADGEYPYLDRVVWARADGWEVARWSVLSEERPTIVLESRPYFRAVRDGGGWQLPRLATRFALQTVRMRTTAKKTVVVSLPSHSKMPPLPPGVSKEPPAVVIGTTELVSTWSPVLPADTGFAVIDDEGRVMMHSRTREALSHNLFTETDDSVALTAQVRARRRTALDVQYWGEPHRFWVSPLWPGSPLTLVVFRPYAALRAVAVEVTEEAAIVSGAYFLLAFLTSLLFFAIQGRRLSWLWPMPARTGIYVGLCLTYALLGAFFVRALRSWHEEACLVAGILLPLAALGLTAVLFCGSALHEAEDRGATAASLLGAIAGTLALAWCQSSPYAIPALAVALVAALAIAGWRHLADDHAQKRRVAAAVEQAVRDLRLQRYEARVLFPYCVACVTFWALFTVLPAVAFVKGAAERAVRRLGRHEVLAHAAAREARDRAIEEKFHQGWPPGVAEKRRSLSLDVYLPSSIERPPQAPFGRAVWPKSGLAADLYEWIAESLDGKYVLTAFGKDLRALGEPGAGGGAWLSSQGREWFKRVGSEALFVTEPGFGHFVGLPVLAGLAFMLFGPLAAWVRWSARHIFLGAIGNPCRRTLGEVVAAGPHRAYCVLPSRTAWRRALADARVDLLDPDDPRLDAKLGEYETIAIDALPNAAAPDRQRRRRLRVLERALGGKQRVVVLASGPPLSLERRAAAEPPAEAEWLAALGRLSLVWLRTPPVSAPVADARAGELCQDDHDVRRLVSEEIQASPELAWMLESLPRHSFADFRYEDLVAHLARLAAPVYTELWYACTPEEKLTLLQVAQEGVINPRRSEAVRSLLNKGLLRREPQLLVMNKSFRRFLNFVPDRAEILALESVRSESFSWDDVRLPFLTLGGVAAFVVFSTERQVFDSTLLFVSAVSATALPALSRVVTSVGARMASSGSSDKGANA